MEMPFQPNEGKNLEIDTDYGRYARYPVKTHVITKDDVLEDVLDKYVREYIQPGDTIIMSEKIVAISQGRAFPIEEIKVSRLAKILSHFVVKTNYNICGMKARAIDGPCEYTLPPYNHYAKMAPDKPDEVAERLTKYLGVDVVIIDANDIGANVLGKPRKDMPDEFPIQAFKDNPLDQCSQQTPIAIVRKVS